MKIAVVGTSKKLSIKEEQLMKNKIVDILDKYPRDGSVSIISGGAKGVDSFAVDIAKKLGFRTKEYLPEKQSWKYFKIRNQKIADECDVIFCFTISKKENDCYHHKFPEKPHLKTGGCWTLEKAREMGKPSDVILI
jgi:predicted Rossmann fold nucleotide-binding protein DprA/Smf involved in DNA uptake